MTRRVHSVVASVAASCALLACGGRGLRWEYTIPDALDGSPMHARVRDGGCTGVVRWQDDFVDGEPSSGGPTLPAGTYGVELEVIDAACSVVARGCEEVTLPMGEAMVRVDVEEIAVETGACTEPDASVPDDGSVDDGSMDDGGVSDSGVDAGPASECTTSDDCTECAGDVCTAGRCVPARPATVVEAGTFHSCAIGGGMLFCWGGYRTTPPPAGEGPIGEVGAGWDSRYEVPTRIGSVPGWTDLSLQSRTTCGIAGGIVRCWGSNYTAQAGVDPTRPASENLFVPTAAADPVHAVRLAVGNLQSFAFDAAGGLIGWGENQHGQIGAPAGITEDRLLPMPIGTDTWLALASGGVFTCGIDDDHDLFCWGQSNDGSLAGSGWPAAIRIPEDPEWSGLALGLTHACAWDAAGALYCWGRGTGVAEGALGAGSPASNAPEPSRVGDLHVVQAGLSNHTCVVDTSSSLWCFGPNESGQLGIGTTETAFEPMPVAGDGWTQVSAGFHHTCGLRGGRIYCWGSDANWSLGNGAEVTANQLTPVRACLPE